MFGSVKYFMYLCTTETIKTIKLWQRKQLFRFKKLNLLKWLI